MRVTSDARTAEGIDNGIEKDPPVRYYVMGAVGEPGAPLYEPNPQTGEALTLDWPARVVVATNTVFHNRHLASRVIAPVVSR